MKRRIISSVLALVMVLSLMMVPSISVNAAEPVYDVTVSIPENSSVKYDETKLPLLYDGAAAADATAFSDARYMSFENTGFKHGEEDPVNAVIELTRDLGAIKPVKSASLSVFLDTNSMIGCPVSVYFYGSVDGDCWYSLNAESGGSIPKEDARVETAEMLIKTDNTRAIFNIQYVKAVVTIDYGWLFASELGVEIDEAPVEGSTTNPAGPYKYVTEGTAGIRVYKPADQPEGGFDLSKAETKNAQVLKLKATGVAGVYDITFNLCNPWPDGQSGIMKLADDELMVAINTGGKIVKADGTIDIESAAKWAVRGMIKDADDDGNGFGDFARIIGETIYFYPAAHSRPAEVTVSVPEGSTFEYDETKLPYLTDGEAAADATAFSDTRYVSFKNAGFVHGEEDPVNGTIEFLANFGEIRHVAGATLNVFVDTNSMIGKPVEVMFYGSVDGDNWYQISGGNAAKPTSETVQEELKEWGFGTESTAAKSKAIKAIYDIQYVKAVVTIDYGWIFASEFDILTIDDAAAGTTTNPAGPFTFAWHTTDNIGILTAEDVPEGGLDLSAAGTKTKQLIKAKATDIAGVYDITFNKVNPWVSASDNGHKGIMTLAEDEILIVISAKNGNLFQNDGSADLMAAAKYTARGLTYDADDDGEGSGDYVVLNGSNLFLYPAGQPIPAYNADAARVGKLISVGKTYTTSPLHRQGGADVGWAWDENAPISYPDEDGKSLTDGVILPAEESFSDAAFAGFNFGTPDYKELGYSWINLDLGEVTDISKIALTFGTSKLGSGIGANNLTVRFYTSEDGETWTYLGEQQAVDSTEEITTDVVKSTNVKGRYVKAEFSRAGWMFVTELSVYEVRPAAQTLYVNAIDDVINYSVSGKYNNVSTLAGTEGYAAIISDPAKLPQSLAWVNVAYFAPTDVDGVYAVTGIQTIAGEATAPLEFPEGGFVYITNTGNDWPTLCKAYKEALEADPNTTMEKPWYYDQYKDAPNSQTPQVNASFTAVANLKVGMDATLVNVNLELSTISDRFLSYILVNDDADMPYVDGAIDLGDIDLTDKEMVKVEVDGYDYVDAPDAGWPDNAGNSLIDGKLNTDNNPAGGENPGWKGKTEYYIDFNFKEATDIYAVEIQVRQLMGWGISRGTEVQYYGTTDGENYFYLGTGYISADAFGEDGTVADGIYPYTLELAKYAKGLTGIRVALCKDGTGWLFADEFAAYTAQEAAPETSEPEVSEPETSTPDVSEPVTPPTGDMSIAFFALVLIVTCGAVVVARKRRA